VSDTLAEQDIVRLLAEAGLATLASLGVACRLYGA
jgi:hypothetical protein